MSATFDVAKNVLAGNALQIIEQFHTGGRAGVCEQRYHTLVWERDDFRGTYHRWSEEAVCGSVLFLSLDKARKLPCGGCAIRFDEAVTYAVQKPGTVRDGEMSPALQAHLKAVATMMGSSFGKVMDAAVSRFAIEKKRLDMERQRRIDEEAARLRKQKEYKASMVTV